MVIQVRLLPFHRDWEIKVLSFLTRFHFKGMALRSLRKTFLGWRRPQRGRERIYSCNFSKVNTLKWYLIVVLICISLRITNVEIFCVPVGHLYAFFGKMSLQVFCPFLNWVLWFFDIELYELFIYFGFLPLIGHIICKYFLPFSRFSFHFVNGFLCCAKAFKFN